jgi:CelD/BcsL family acetyltransferase involved in cellulose biosynthesis
MGLGTGVRLREERLSDADPPGVRDHVEIASGDAFDALAEEWDDLALRTGAPPFARPGWIRAWWGAFGRGELCILTLRRDGELSALLPLARHRGLLRSCSNVHSPLFDGVCANADGLVALLTAAMREGGKGVILGGLDSEGQLAAAARQVADQTGCRLVVFDRDVAPYVEATMSREEYEHSLGSSKRHQLRRKRRRLADSGELNYEVFERPDGLEDRLEQFLRLESSGWKARSGTAIRLRADTRRFYSDAADWAAQSNLLRLSFLSLDHRPVVGWFLIGDEAHQYSLKTGYDEEFSRYSPGMLLALEEIGDALEGGRTFEFGEGMNRMKETLGNAERTFLRVGLYPRTVRGTLARWAAQGNRAVYRRARESAVLRRARDAVRVRRARRSASPPGTDSTPG